MNGLLYNSLGARIGGVETRMLALEQTFTTRFDLLMGKISELDTRLGILEDRSKH